MNLFRLKISKPVLFALGLGLALLLISGLAAQDLIRVPWFETTRRKFLLYNGTQVDLFGEKKLEQTFKANYPGLAQIDILIKENKVEGRQITLHLRNICGAQADIIQVTATLPSIEDFIFYPFEFAPIDNSAGQSYCIVLEVPEAAPDTAVQLQLSTGDLYPHGTLTINDPQTESEMENHVLEGGASGSFQYKIYLPIIMRGADTNNLVEDMGFRLHYKGFLLPTAQVFVSRLTANKPLIWGQPWFYGGLVVAYVILLMGLFYVARQTVQVNGKKHD